MSRKKLIESEQISTVANLDLITWPMVNDQRLTPEDREVFLKRKKAVELYIKNKTSLQEISNITGIVKSEIRRFVKRCLELDQTGNIWGFRALIPHKHVKSYNRKMFESHDNSTNPNLIGSFQLLLRTYPVIKETIDDLYLGRKKGIGENIIKIKHLHKRFVDVCRSTGLTINDYPLNTKDLGKRSLERYCKTLNEKYFGEAARRYGDEAKRQANTTGIGQQNYPITIRPYHRVQFDGHRIDAIFSISFTTPEGDVIEEVMERVWLLVIIDVATRVILGYHISFNSEYSSSDVLKCVRNAVVPWSPKTFSIPGLKYPEGGCFATEIIQEAKWGLWDELLYDNGKANLAQNVKDRLHRVIGCSINAGPIKMPERRSLIERFFKTLEENGYQRLPSTTGSHPKDPKRRNPEKKAIQYSISADHVEELTELLIANYNRTPHEGVYNLSPLEAFQQRVSRGMGIRQMPEENRNEVTFLTIEIQRTVQGNIKSGKRPYINFEGVAYRSEVLSQLPGLIGTKLDLFINVDDLRVIRAFLPDGSDLGLLTAIGKWGITPHSLQIRKQINKLRKNKVLFYTSHDDPIEVYHNYLLSQAKSKKKDRNRLAELDREIKQGKQIEPNLSEKVICLEQSEKENKIDQVNYSPPNKDLPQRRLRKTIIF